MSFTIPLVDLRHMADVAPGAGAGFDPGLPEDAGDALPFLHDLATPGALVEVDPDDAERAGAFAEDALSPEDAAEAVFDAREDV